MSRQTTLLIPPTLEEIKALAKSIDLPEIEAEAFFWHYQSNGWKVGKVAMKCWKSALQGWRIRWQQRSGDKGDRSGAGERWMMNKEYERILDRMKAIRASYAEHQTWDAKDRAEWQRLKSRKEELMKKLGIMI